MATNKPVQAKKYFTVAEANARLPLVRAIVKDITELAISLRDRHERLTRLKPNKRIRLDAQHEEELLHIQQEFDRDQERMQSYIEELSNLGVELKDYFTGLIDFPAWMHGREVYLCWRLGEPEVRFWHDLEAGFAGRQELPKEEGPASQPSSGLQGSSL